MPMTLYIFIPMVNSNWLYTCITIQSTYQQLKFAPFDHNLCPVLCFCIFYFVLSRSVFSEYLAFSCKRTLLEHWYRLVSQLAYILLNCVTTYINQVSNLHFLQYF